MLDFLLQYLLNCGLIFSFSIAIIDKYVVKVPETFFHVLEDCIHYFLKSCRSIGNAKWYHCILEKSLFDTEGYSSLITCYYPNQIVPILQVQPNNLLFVVGSVVQFTDKWQGVLDQHCKMFQSSIIDTESKGSFLLTNKQNRRHSSRAKTLYLSSWNVLLQLFSECFVFLLGGLVDSPCRYFCI